MGFNIDKKAEKNILPYITQSILALLSTIVILCSLDILKQSAIVAALGSSVFVVFAMPNHYTARPKSVIGVHLIGVICGLTCILLLKPALDSFILYKEFNFIFSASLAVALSMFLMCLTNTEHAPASGTALGIVVHSWTYNTILFILLGAILLSLTKKILGARLKDLI